MNEYYIVVDKSYFSKSLLLFSPKYRKRYKLYLDLGSKQSYSDFNIGDHIRISEDNVIRKVHKNKKALPLFEGGF